MVKPRVIAFGHRRQRGKDTAATYLADDYGFAHDAFAHSLKEGIGRGVFGLSDDQLYGPLHIKETVDRFWKLTPRDILQRAGTEAMRHTFGGDVWVRTLFRRAQTRDIPTVVSDVRFIDEIEAVKTNDGFAVRIDRNIPYDPEVDEHQSEKDLVGYTNWDWVINNDGTLESLYEKLDLLMKELKWPKKVLI